MPTDTLEKNTKTAKIEKEPEIIIFELTDVGNSNYILEGSENTSNPIRLTCAGIRRIPNISRMRVGGPHGAFERIRYIKGCNEILIKKQKEQNWEPNTQTGEDEIYILMGKTILINDGDGKVLAKFLRNHQCNITNPMREKESTPLFRELKNEEEAEKGIDEFLTLQKAMNVVNSLVTVKGENYIYDEGQIDFLCDLFNIKGIEPSEYMTKLKAIIDFAKVQPTRFINSVADKLASIKVDVNLALQFGVLVIEEDRLLLDKTIMVTVLRSKSKEDKVEEAIKYFMSPEGGMKYKQLMISLAHAKQGGL